MERILLPMMFEIHVVMAFNVSWMLAQEKDEKVNEKNKRAQNERE